MCISLTALIAQTAHYARGIKKPYNPVRDCRARCGALRCEAARCGAERGVAGINLSHEFVIFKADN